MNEDKRIKIAINMIEEMIVDAEEHDKLHREQKITEGKGDQAVGESWLVFHLKNLKKLLQDGPI